MFSWNKLHKGIKAVFFVQIVNRLGDFVFPFLTLLLTQVQGLSPTTAGIVVTLTSILQNLGGLVAGKISDKHSRRNVLLLFWFISGGLLTATGFAPASAFAVVTMVLSGFFLGAMRPVLNTLVADLSEPETRRAAFSLSYLGINIGVAVGPLMAGWLFHHALSWMFWLDGLSTGIALIILYKFVPCDSKIRQISKEAEKDPNQDSSVKIFIKDPLLFPFGLLCIGYSFIYAQMIFVLSLQLVSLFGVQGSQIYGTVWACNAIVVIAFTPILLRLTRKVSNLKSISLAMFFFAMGLISFLFHPSVYVILLATIVWTTGEVLFSINRGEFITSHSPSELRGSFQGYSDFMSNLGYMISPVLSGLMIQYIGLQGVWIFAILLLVFLGFCFSLLNKKL